MRLTFSSVTLYIFDFKLISYLSGNYLAVYVYINLPKLNQVVQSANLNIPKRVRPFDVMIMESSHVVLSLFL